jgi:fructose-specific phosphotransferase system IIC component
MAATLLGVFLSVFALTLSESLHRSLHEEACEPSHQCAVTMLQSGQVETPVCFVTPTPATAVTMVEVVAETIFVPSADYSLPPSCGPPALLA